MPPIWTHEHLLSHPHGQVSSAPKPTLGEGNTPLVSFPTLADQLGVARLFLKREDLNPSGSHKDRGLLYQVVEHSTEGQQTFVISSSGNAAVSAAAACQVTGNRLIAFVSPSTNPGKMSSLLQSDAVVVSCPKPLNFARYASRVFGLTNLRGTKDPIASVGYRTIAAEVREQEESVAALFTFSSSGISLQGIADGFQILGNSPQLWAVQSGECIGIVRALHPDTPTDPTSPAGRLGIKTPPGAEKLAQTLVATGGGAVAVEGQQVMLWQDRLEQVGVRTSPEGAAVLAGIARTEGLQDSSVVAVMTGKPHPTGGNDGGQDLPTPQCVESYLDVRQLLQDDLGLTVRP
jgi:threonine synthase